MNPDTVGGLVLCAIAGALMVPTLLNRSTPNRKARPPK